MRTLHTPDHRFQRLPDYSFDPHYSTVSGLRMHYIDEGDPDAKPVVMLHGVPTWSFLYRHMIPPVTAAGFRALAPDLIGFGRSDKPAEPADYSYQRMVTWTEEWLKQHSLEHVFLVCQDWGAFIGLRLVARNPKMFGGFIVANGFLPDGIVPLSPAFHVWRFLSGVSPVLPASLVVRIGCTRSLTGNVKAGYDAPYPDQSYQAVLRALPQLVPSSPDDPEAVRNQHLWTNLSSLDKPVLTVFGDHDPIFHGMDKILQQRLPGAIGQPHRILSGAGHFIQEDRGRELAEIIIQFIRNNL